MSFYSSFQANVAELVKGLELLFQTFVLKVFLQEAPVFPHSPADHNNGLCGTTRVVVYWFTNYYLTYKQTCSNSFTALVPAP